MALSRVSPLAPASASKRADHPAQLVDGAAETLPVLLGEFGALRGHDAAGQAETEGDDSDDARHASKPPVRV